MKNQTPQRVKIEGTARFQRLLAGAPETCGMKSGAVILQPGESVGEHVTRAREEAIIILEGRAEVFVAGKPVFTSGPEELVYIPPETAHDIRNSGTVPLRYVYVVVPGQPLPDQK
ncbi:MAG TPA: cupin domain-containing protein [Candidatus Omnitrophota bacterium]|nr:cupin domain-containing protein [Candidatus Omnitrophota bacterium]